MNNKLAPYFRGSNIFPPIVYNTTYCEHSKLGRKIEGCKRGNLKIILRWDKVGLKKECADILKDVWKGK